MAADSLLLNSTIQAIVINVPSCHIPCRSLWTILSTCFLTIFACVYTAVHHNVPSPYDRQLSIVLRDICGIILSIATPELIVVWATRQWVSARYFTREMDHWLVNEKCPSHDTLKKQATNNSGDDRASSVRLDLSGNYRWESQGDTLCTSTATDKVMKKHWLESWLLDTKEDESWTTAHSFYAYMGGFMIYYNGRPFSTITPRKLLRCLKDGTIDPIHLTKNEVEDCSKGNIISKGLVIIQVAWFVIQLVARRIDRTAITPLEIGTLAFSVPCFATYMCWWNKPLSVRHPRRLDWKGHRAPPGDLHLDEVHEGYNQEITMAPVRYVVRKLQRAKGNSKHQVETFGGDDIEFLNSLGLKGSRNPHNILFAVGFAVTFTFGIIHLSAWNFHFPSPLEQIVWRVSSVILVSVPVYMGFLVVLRSYISFFSVPLPFFFTVVFIILSTLYVASRVSIVIMMLTTLRDLPPSAYQTVPWAEFIPHI